jgi:hypothetical protein
LPEPDLSLTAEIGDHNLPAVALDLVGCKASIQSSLPQKKTSSSSKIRRGSTSPYLFPPSYGEAGISTSIPFSGTGCCGFEGPLPPPLWIRCPDTTERDRTAVGAVCQAKQN